MTTVDIDYLDGNITVPESEPSTIAELTEAYGEQLVVDETTSNLRYRNKYPRVYKKASAEFEAMGSARPQKVKDGTPVVKKTTKKVEGQPDEEVSTPVLVDAMEHLRQLYADDAQKELVIATITKHAQAEPLYVKGERTAGGGKISQQAMDIANAKFAAGEDAVDAAVTQIETNVPGYKVTRDAEGTVAVEALARGVQALIRFCNEQAKKQAKGLLG